MSDLRLPFPYPAAAGFPDGFVVAFVKNVSFAGFSATSEGHDETGRTGVFCSPDAGWRWPGYKHLCGFYGRCIKYLYAFRLPTSPLPGACIASGSPAKRGHTPATLFFEDRVLLLSILASGSPLSRSTDRLRGFVLLLVLPIGRQG